VKELYRHRDSVRVGYYKTILEEAKIRCFIKNLHAASSGLGLAAGDRFDPVLCVLDDGDYDNAHLILGAHEFPEKLEGEPWVCSNCSEEVPGEFDTCWNCETTVPLAGDVSSE